MDSIELKNFKRFIHLEKLYFAPITIFVGANNSGKSTIAKSLLLISSFFKENIYDKDSIDKHRFYFNKNNLAHTGNSLRALNFKSKDNIIEFRSKVSVWEICIKIDCSNKEQSFGEVIEFSITDLMYNINYICDFIYDKVKLQINNKPVDFSNKVFSLNADEYFASLNLNKPYLFEISLYEIMKVRGSFYDPKQNHSLPYFTISLFNQLIRGIKGDTSSKLRTRKIKPSFLDSFDDKIFDLLIQYPYSEMFNSRLNLLLDGFNIEYIYAHSISQDVLYNAKDKDDYFVRTVCEFADENIAIKNIGVYEFVIYWMNIFGIGKSYKLKSFGGEAYSIKIINNEGAEEYLADKGIGAIKVMTLIMRLAIVACSPKKQFDEIVIVEEPEQNLHPMLQSKLADLFYDVYKRYNIKCIIETHSEYLVRSTQVIVSRNYNTNDLLNANPFKVYYFPSEGQPYDMEYQSDGLFKNSFSEGFLDEGGRLYMMMIKNSRMKR